MTAGNSSFAEADSSLDALALIEAAIRHDQAGQAVILRVADPKAVMVTLARFVAVLLERDHDEPLEHTAYVRGEYLAWAAGTGSIEGIS